MHKWTARLLVFLALSVSGWAVQPMKWEKLMVIKRAAEKGDAEAQFLLALQYKVGDGIDRDLGEAAKWLRKAAEAGHAEAQNALGEFLADPQNEHANLQEAEKWLQASAAQGNPDAKAHLEKMAAERAATKAAEGGASPGPESAPSREMNEDPAETVRWSVLLSGLRGAEAFLVRGFLLENGIGVNRDLAAAADSYQKAADQGDERAQYRLGLMYAEGRGVARDVDRSIALLNQAAAHGSHEAADALARLKLPQAGERKAVASGPVPEKSAPPRKP